MNHTLQTKNANTNIPLLLAGPIIRRIDKLKVCIWIATSKNVQARVKIFRIEGPLERKENEMALNKIKNSENNREPFQHNFKLIGEGVNNPLELGDNLFINLVMAKPLNENKFDDVLQQNKSPLEFPLNELLAYDVELELKTETGTSEIVTLKDLDLLSGKDSILYQPYEQTVQNHTFKDDIKDNRQQKYPNLPMFFIPDANTTLNILYGSCRKLHGDDVDSLIIGDKLMQNSFFDLGKRPSALFLIGDQIYADEVAGPLITYISKFSTQLLGWEETIDGLDKIPCDLKVGERKEIVSKAARFTSESSENHLLSFGEFAAMYIVAWNRLSWPEHFDPPPKDNNGTSYNLQNYINELKELEESRRNLIGIRRLLANIPSYMICDDHEITDDWNINKRWHDDVNQSEVGKQIISNGLLAYWAFQSWGNDPESFDRDFISKIKNYLDSKKQQSIKPSLSVKTTFDSISTPTSLNDTILSSENIKEFENQVLLGKNWTYVAPTYPLTVFLDCRTQRTFIDKEGPPFLLSDTALDQIKIELNRHGYQNGEPLIIVSPTPVFGFELAESVQRFLTTISGSYKWDLETWRANEQGFIRFLMYIVKNFEPSYCIFLSGDVHYAFTMKANVDHIKTINDENKDKKVDADHQFDYTLPIAQLTSSPFRSNKLKNRIVAILILNLFHKLIVSKKKIFRFSFRKKYRDSSSTHMNYDYYRGFQIHSEHKEKDSNSINHYVENQKKIHFSKYEPDQSILDKIKIISSNLMTRYFQKNQDKKIQKDFLPWAEHRLLIKPKGLGTLPVLPKNNMGYVYLDLYSKTVKHTLFYLDKDNVKRIEASISFD